MSEHTANTEVQEMSNTGVNHVEGGWPKEINPAELEQVTRFKKKIEKDESYTATILKLADIIDDVVAQEMADNTRFSFFVTTLKGLVRFPILLKVCVYV